MSEATVEDRAKEMGWAPKEEFRGDPERWIDAETFIKRGEEIMPILQANNRKLSKEVSDLRGELAKNQNLLKASAESIEALKEFNTKASLKIAKEKKQELILALTEAKRAGDVEAEVELTDQLQEHNLALKEAEEGTSSGGKPAAKPAAGGDGEDFTQDPSWKTWMSENSDWYGKDRRRTSIALAIADELRSDGSMKGIVGKPFLDKVKEETDKVLGINQRPSSDKVEGSRGGSGGGGGGEPSGKSYGDLPAEAKQACERQAARVVGEGRAFKTKAEWQKHYATKYFE